MSWSQISPARSPASHRAKRIRRVPSSLAPRPLSKPFLSSAIWIEGVVLVVDDECPIRMRLVDGLEDVGFRVIELRDAEVATSLLTSTTRSQRS